MKKDGNSPARQGITNVYELNDLLNELWHTIPPGKGRKALRQVERVLHQRICNQDNPDCWLCQYRYRGEIDGMLGVGSPDSGESDQQQTQGLDIVRWLNDSVNGYMRARQLGQSPPQSLEVLKAIHEEVSRRKSHDTDCMFCLAERLLRDAAKLTPQQFDSLAGLKPILGRQQSASEAEDIA